MIRARHERPKAMDQVKRAIPVLVLIAVASILTPRLRGATEKVYRGYITDSQCAMNVHSLSQSHKEMLQSKDVGNTPADCVWYCVKQRGGRFVLQDKSKVYKLDDQNIIRELAGKRVEVTGTLNPQTNTIHIRKMEVIADDPSHSE
jgi:hypothetical protein